MSNEKQCNEECSSDKKEQKNLEFAKEFNLKEELCDEKDCGGGCKQ